MVECRLRGEGRGLERRWVRQGAVRTTETAVVAPKLCLITKSRREMVNTPFRAVRDWLEDPSPTMGGRGEQS